MKQQYLLLGEIVRPQGIRGEVKVKHYTDDPERFYDLEEVFLKRQEADIAVSCIYLLGKRMGAQGRRFAPCAPTRVLLDLHKNGLLVFGSGSAHHSADRLGDTTLLADHLAHILGRNMQLKDGGFRPDSFFHSHGVLIVHQRLGHVFNQLFHPA